MTPEASAERHLQVIAELGVIRQLLFALCKQSPDPEGLLATFEQGCEEVRHNHEVSTGQTDERFDARADQFARWIALAVGIQRPTRG